ncbi:MAG: transketolase, partial [Bacteroidia bacterium]|nr:transketolase [Bacteroidia bacterium]
MDWDKLATQIRRDVVRMVHRAQSGHPGGALGCVEYFLALYFRVMRHDPARFSVEGRGEDVFILSNGHICAAWYAVLARCGYFPIEELATFRKIGSRLQGHPSPAKGLPGVRAATGSLGQGLSVACGYALGKKLSADPHRVFVLLGDGETQEGQVWEAALFAAHHRLDNLVAAIDLNYKQIDGDVRQTLGIDPVADKWRAFGWTAAVVENPYDIDALTEVLSSAARAADGRPQIIILRTVMGKGVDFMENDHRWHGKAPNDAQFAAAI